MHGITCKIVFDKPNAAYYPGEEITGKVIVNIPSDFEVKSIILSLSGECHAQVSKLKYFYDSYSSNNSDGYAATVINDDKEMFNFEKILHYSLDGRNLFVGRETYSFSHFLMPDLPTTIDTADSSLFTDLGLVSLLPDTSHVGKRGMIRYKANVTIEFLNNYRSPKIFSKEFLVCSKLDLNQVSDASEPFFYEESKVYRKLFHKIAPLSVKIEVPSKGYVPGQIMPIILYVDNKSDLSITIGLKFKARLILNVRGESRVLSKTIEKIIKSLSIGANKKIIIEANYLVPNLPPSYTNLSLSNVSTTYIFEVKAVAHRMLKLWMRNWNVLRFISDQICIGSIPLQNDFQSEATTSSTIESESVELAEEA